MSVWNARIETINPLYGKRDTINDNALKKSRRFCLRDLSWVGRVMGNRRTEDRGRNFLCCHPELVSGSIFLDADLRQHDDKCYEFRHLSSLIYY